MENVKTFTVTILTDKLTHHVRQVAHTHWEAVDRVYNKFCGVQPDRSKYVLNYKRKKS